MLDKETKKRLGSKIAASVKKYQPEILSAIATKRTIEQILKEEKEVCNNNSNTTYRFTVIFEAPDKHGVVGAMKDFSKMTEDKQFYYNYITDGNPGEGVKKIGKSTIRIVLEEIEA